MSGSSLAFDYDVVTGPAPFGPDSAWEVRSAENGQVLRSGRERTPAAAMHAGTKARRNLRARARRRAQQLHHHPDVLAANTSRTEKEGSS